MQPGLVGLNGGVARNLDTHPGFRHNRRVATVLRYGKTRVVVYSNDHPPAHVHAVGPGGRARFVLNCPDGPVELWDCTGAWAAAELNRLGVAIAAQISDCCRI